MASAVALTVAPSAAAMREPFVPRSVTVAGRRLSSWSYDRRTRVLSASFRMRSGTLTVR